MIYDYTLNFLLISPQEVQLAWEYYQWPYPQRMVPSPSSCYHPKAHQLGVEPFEFLPYLCWNLNWLDIVLVNSTIVGS